MERFIVDIQEEATSGSGVKQENQVQDAEQRAPKRAAPRIKRPSLRRGLGAKRRLLQLSSRDRSCVWIGVLCPIHTE